MLSATVAAATTLFANTPASASVGGCTASDWQGYGYRIGVCINDRGTTTTAFPDIYVNANGGGSNCSILIEVWDGNGINYSHKQVGCAVGHYNGYATPVFGNTSLHAFARLLVNGKAYGTENSPSITLGTTGKVLYDFDFTVTAYEGLSHYPIHGHASDAFAALHRCFNCNFPVSNAPAAFPSDDQYVDLNGCPSWVSLACSTWGVLDAPVRFHPAEQNNYIMINSQPGHWDKPGSALKWTFGTDGFGLLHLYAESFVLGSSVPDAANIAGAQTAWQSYASQLGNNLYNYCGSQYCS